MRILYFAQLREKVGRAEEDIAAPAGVDTVAALVDWLKARGPEFADAFKDMRTVRVAVNQEHVQLDHAVADGDEVALFPPVTGG